MLTSDGLAKDVGQLLSLPRLPNLARVEQP